MPEFVKLASVERVRRISLALPEAEERQTWGHPTFRVRDKIFVIVGDDDRMALKAPPGAQPVLVNAAPDRFYVPAYVGHKGWVGIVLEERADWHEIEQLIRRSYRMTAPKKLIAGLE